jgi:hypothetical protein
MAAKSPLSFADILAAESDYVLPSTDAEIQAALVAYGAIFKSTKGKAQVAARADLLAGLALLHTHHADPVALATVLSIAQHQTLATALDLDFQAHGSVASWPAMLARRALSKQMPGQSPKKRKPASSSADGQIQKPGDGGAQANSADAGKGPSSSKKQKTASKAKAASSSDASEAASSDGDADASSPGPAVTELMPDELGSGPAFDALVRAICARRWLSTNAMEAAIPSTYLSRLFRGKTWTEKLRSTYNKMITKQTKGKPSDSRREDPTNVAFPHRLKFAFSPDDSLEFDADNLRFACAGERLSDWAGTEGRALGGHYARSVFQQLLTELADAWGKVSGAIQRGEHIGAPVTKHLTDVVLTLFERRYTRFAKVLPAGRAREEILANVARQLGELRAFFTSFDTFLADSTTRMDYGSSARWFGKRVNTLFAPTVALFLAVDGDGGDAGSAAPACGAGGAGGAGSYSCSTATPPSAGKTPRSILKSPAPAVSFADGSPAPAPYAPPPAYFPPLAAAPVAAAPTWPPFYPQSLLFSDSGGLPRQVPQYHIPSLSGPAYGGGLGAFSGAPAAPPAYSTPPTPASPMVSVKPEPGSARPRDKSGRDSTEKLRFLSQPLHVYVAGTDAGTVPPGTCLRPPCGCSNRMRGVGVVPGPHATWDCPLRYVAQCGYCPGFNNDGSKDPAQWLPGGEVLTRAAKDAWLELIRTHDLPLANEAGAQAPDFRK